MSKNPAAVALGKLAAKKRTKEELAAAGRLGGLAKAKARQNGTSSALANSNSGQKSTVQPKKKR